jgi:8-oxo-dGTP pyrophosphatase MutT (NUDIX family)
VAERIDRYFAAGGVVVRDCCVLVLHRPGKDEIRLPKGHIQPQETVQQAALREVGEESGYTDLTIEADLGSQRVEFVHQGHHVVRNERFFLMAPAGQGRQPAGEGEAQFDPVWLTWDEALEQLTFEAEREWVRRARRLVENGASIGDEQRYTDLLIKGR